MFVLRFHTCCFAGKVLRCLGRNWDQEEVDEMIQLMDSRRLVDPLDNLAPAKRTHKLTIEFPVRNDATGETMCTKTAACSFADFCNIVTGAISTTSHDLP